MKKIKVAVDIGNSNIVIGLFINCKWEKVYRLSSKKNITYWSFKNKLKKIISLNDFNPSNVESVVISSVVPTLTDVVRLSSSDMLSENIMIIKSKEVKNINLLECAFAAKFIARSVLPQCFSKIFLMMQE